MLWCTPFAKPIIRKMLCISNANREGKSEDKLAGHIGRRSREDMRTPRLEDKSDKAKQEETLKRTNRED